METFRTKLLQKQEVAEGTQAFRFEKPQNFHFRAGQFIDLTLIDPPETDPSGSTRTFTLASASYENELMVATRMRRQSVFKRTLAALPLGAEALIEGPMGSFTLHSNASKAAVPLAGGIGITPFLSIAKQAAHERLPHRVHLFYSNRRPEDASFLETLAEMEKAKPRFRLIATRNRVRRRLDDAPARRNPPGSDLFHRRTAGNGGGHAADADRRRGGPGRFANGRIRRLLTPFSTTAVALPITPPRPLSPLLRSPLRRICRQGVRDQATTRMRAA